MAEPKKYEYIDSLRGIAILMVVGVHILSFFKVSTSDFFPPLLIDYIYDFRCGVSLFFIVSAYTLTMSHERRKDEKRATRNFFIRRFFRIAPIYYSAIILIYLFNIDHSAAYIKAIPTFWFLSNFLFLNTLSPYIIGTIVPGGWSVSAEFIFYFLFPILTIWVRNTNTSLIFFGIFIAIASIFHYNFYDDPFLSKFEFMEVNFLNQVPIFFLGIFAYHVTQKKDYRVSPYTVVFLACVCLLFAHIPFPYYFMWTIAFTALVIILSKYSLKAFSNKVLASVGKVSFSMYIIHFLVIMALNNFEFGRILPITGFISSLLNFILLYSIVAAVTFCLSNITYKFIEIPGQNLGRKIIKKLDQQNNITV
ncbi:acyltransferase family protein [Dysgonomonas macrotermitis]|uniref:Peptidoglycan/LPS O-acetylase OafA/YrhL, contains acyltransferase and SGNH-hydrolase domains n=1 Tax=Dysgonomonas macrotermitis TaxID=1346286 RepID=A0A1M5AUR7_9BACT|nr:acyltransferase [Dysgonomonas macrotermitis]SHF34008.1 Peptidoglycan/LPS O-acetylase OafA/YrhL, contains acyltransferase and SGNH-hydrolase domains [Dysgonomonas macrotermitis]